MSNSGNTLTRDSVLQEIESNWNELQTYLASLTPEQLTRPTDAVGWTAKDHMIHLATFARAELAVLEGRSKRETLDIDPEMWERGEDDEINGMIQQRYHDMPLDEVMQTLKQNHEQVMNKLNTLTEADLLLPYSHYQSDSQDTRALLQYLPWDTAYHYRDHLPWIKAIVEQV